MKHGSHMDTSRLRQTNVNGIGKAIKRKVRSKEYKRFHETLKLTKNTEGEQTNEHLAKTRLYPEPTAKVRCIVPNQHTRH